MKRIFCKICGEQWIPDEEPAYYFIERHMRMHNIPVPYGTGFKSMEEYVDALEKWVNYYFGEKSEFGGVKNGG